MNNNNLLKQEILLDFEKSIENIKDFSDTFGTLDTKIESTRQQLQALKADYASITGTVRRSLGKDLKSELEKKMNEAIKGAEITMASLGTDNKIQLKKETMKKMFKDVEDLVDDELRNYVKDLKTNMKSHMKEIAGTPKLDKKGKEIKAFNPYDEIDKKLNSYIKNRVALPKGRGMQIDEAEFNKLLSSAENQINISIRKYIENMNEQLRQIRIASLNPLDPKAINELNDSVYKAMGGLLTDEEKGKINEGITKFYKKQNQPVNIIKQEDLNRINKHIIALIHKQVKRFMEHITSDATLLLSPQTLKQLPLVLEKKTVTAIMKKVKGELLKTLLDPQVTTDKVKLTFNQNDLKSIVSKLKKAIKASIDTDLSSFDKIDTGKTQFELQELKKNLDKAIHKYVSDVNRKINEMEAQGYMINKDSLDKGFKKHLQRELKLENQDELNKYLQANPMTTQDFIPMNLKYQIQRMLKEFDGKVNKNFDGYVKKLIKDIQGIPLNDDDFKSTITQHVVTNIGQINGAIVKKIRQQIDFQFENLQREINGIMVMPRSMKRTQRIERGLKNVNEAYEDDSPSGSNVNVAMGSDPYSRRDNYFNQFGIGGAIENTIRHIIAGSIVGAPMAFMYQGLETFKTMQKENNIMMQNFFLKDEYQNKALNPATGKMESTGTVDMEKLQGSIDDLNRYSNKISNAFGIKPTEVYQTASVASRLLNSTNEMKEFTKIAAQIKTIDPSANMVETIAPGLEAIMSQFSLGVQGLNDRVIPALAVATNVTNATAGDILASLQRAGSTLNVTGASIEGSIAMSALAIQSTGNSGENIGNFLKSAVAQTNKPSARKVMFEELGISTTEIVDGAVKNIPFDKLMEKIGASIANVDETKRLTILNKIFGTYQMTRGTATSEIMSKSIGDVNEISKYLDMMNKIKGFDKDAVGAMLNEALKNPMVAVDRATSSMSTAFASILEELAPTIKRLADMFTGLANKAESAASAIATIATLIGQFLVGYLGLSAVRGGGRYVLEKANYAENSKVNTAMYHMQSANGNFSNLSSFGMGNGNISANAFKDQAGLLNMREILKRPDFMDAVNRVDRFTPDELDQFKRFITDYDLKINNIADLANVVNNFTPKPIRQMTQQEINQGAGLNLARVNQQVFQGSNTSFISDLINTPDFADYNQKMAYNTFGRMTDDDINNFNEFIRSTGTQINSVDDLIRAYDDFDQRQRQMIRNNIETSPSLYSLQQSIQNVNTSLDDMGRRINVFDRAGIAVRSLGNGLLGLASNIKNVIKDLALVLLTAEAIKTLAEYLSTSKEDKAINDAQNNIDMLDNYGRTILERGDDKGFWEQAKETGKDIGMSTLSIFGLTKVMPMEEKITLQRLIAQKSKELYGYSPNTEDFSLDLEAISKDIYKQLGKEKFNTILDSVKEKYRKDQYKEQILSQQRKIFLDNDKKEKDAKAKKEAENELFNSTGESLSKFDPTNFDQQIKSSIDNINTNYELKQTEMFLGNEPFEKVFDPKFAINKYVKYKKDILDTYEGYFDEIEGRKGYNPNDKSTEGELIRKGYLTYSFDYLANKDNEKKDPKEYARQLKIANDVMEIVNKPEYKKLKTDYNNSRLLEISPILDYLNQFIDEAKAQYDMQDKNIELNYDKENDKTFYSKKQENLNSYKSKIQKVQELKTDLFEQVKSYGFILSPEEQKNLDDFANTLSSDASSLSRTSLDLKKEQFTPLMNQLEKTKSGRELLLLQAQLQSGDDTENPLYKAQKLRNLKIESSEIGSVIAEIKNRNAQKISMEERNANNEKIIQLSKQQLQTQLEMLSEMKKGNSTFGLPEGIKPMSMYDFLSNNNTASTYNVSKGDVYLNISLPNVSNLNKQQIEDLAKSIKSNLDRNGVMRQTSQSLPQLNRVIF